MTERIILSIVSIIMLVVTFKKKDKLTTFLTAGLTFGILITWTGISVVISAGLIIYILSALLISFYNLRSKDLSRFNQIIIVLTGLFAFLANLFSIIHFPFASVVKLIMVIPIILYFASIFKGMLKRKEIGYLTIMNVEFGLRLIL